MRCMIIYGILAVYSCYFLYKRLVEISIIKLNTAQWASPTVGEPRVSERRLSVTAKGRARALRGMGGSGAGAGLCCLSGRDGGGLSLGRTLARPNDRSSNAGERPPPLVQSHIAGATLHNFWCCSAHSGNRKYTLSFGKAPYNYWDNIKMGTARWEFFL